MRSTRFFTCIVFLMIPFWASAHRGLTPAECDVFIEKYKDLAIREMHAGGIPASITIAQLIMETGWGSGQLVAGAQNYFGIKGNNGWTGDCFYLKDDDEDNNGNLIPSCFRVYPNASASFADRTIFLRENERYQDLFILPANDYRAWAYGLKKAGYATRKDYAEKLIEKIEMYNLAQYDAMPFHVATTTPPTSHETQTESYFEYVYPTPATEVEVTPIASTLPTDTPSEQNVQPIMISEPVSIVESPPNIAFELPSRPTRQRHLIQQVNRRPNIRK